MAAQIKRDHMVAVRQALQLKFELLSRLGPTWNENQRFTGASFQVTEPDTIAGGNGVFRDHGRVPHATEIMGVSVSIVRLISVKSTFTLMPGGKHSFG